MDVIYILTGCSAFFMLMNSRIHTDSYLKLMGLGLIIIGCFVHLADRDNNLVEIGVACYFSCEIINAFFKKERRHEAST